MINERQIILVLAGALSCAAYVIVDQKQELKKTKSESRLKDATNAVYRRALMQTYDYMTADQLLKAFANFDEEATFQKIIRNI